MKVLTWPEDQNTRSWAEKVDLLEGVGSKATQFDGSSTFLVENTWRNYIQDGSGVLPSWWAQCRLLECSPDNIRQCFRAGELMAGLALTVRWGGIAAGGYETAR